MNPPQSGDEESYFNGDRKQQRPEELAAQREKLPMQNAPHVERRGEQQLQRADAAIFRQLRAGLAREPAFQDRVQDERRDDADSRLDPVGADLHPAPEPAAAQHAEDGPDERGLDAGTRGEPVEGVHVEEAGAILRALRRVAERPAEPAVAPAELRDGRGLVLPRARHDETGGDEKNPAQAVRDDERENKFVGMRFVICVERVGEGGAGTGQEQQHRRLRPVIDAREDGTNERQQGGQPQHDGHAQTRRVACRLRQRRGNHAGGEREEHRVQQNQTHPPEFREAHAAHEQRDGEHRQRGQQSVKSIERTRHQFAGHDIEAAQVGEEQEAERAVAFFLAQTIRRGARPGEQTEQAGNDRQPEKHQEAHLRRVLPEKREIDERADADHGQRDAGAQPIRPALARSHAQFAFDDGEQGHVATNFGE